jgi:hypothetical protein
LPSIDFSGSPGAHIVLSQPNRLYRDQRYTEQRSLRTRSGCSSVANTRIQPPTTAPKAKLSHAGSSRRPSQPLPRAILQEHHARMFACSDLRTVDGHGARAMILSCRIIFSRRTNSTSIRWRDPTEGISRSSSRPLRARSCYRAAAAPPKAAASAEAHCSRTAPRCRYPGIQV